MNIGPKATGGVCFVLSVAHLLGVVGLLQKKRNQLFKGDPDWCILLVWLRHMSLSAMVRFAADFGLFPHKVRGRRNRAHMAMKFPGEFTLKKSPQFLRFLLLGSEGWGTWPEILGARKLLKINCGEVQKFRAGDHQFYDFFVEIMIMPTHSSFPIIWLRFISYFFLAKSPPPKKNITKNKKRRQQGCLGFCVVEPLDGLEVHLRKNSNGGRSRPKT